VGRLVGYFINGPWRKGLCLSGKLFEEIKVDGGRPSMRSLFTVQSDTEGSHKPLDGSEPSSF